MAEGPVGRTCPLSSRHFVRGAEVNPLVDADVDHIVSHIRKAVVRFRLVDRGARDCEGHPVSEEALQRARHGARKIVCTRRVLRIGRCGKQREPGGVASGSRVAIVVPFLNGRDGAPEEVVPLVAPRGDGCVGCRHVGQGEEPGAIADIADIRSRDAPQGSFPQNEEIVGVEQSEVGLRLRAGDGANTSESLDLVIVSGVLAAGQVWRRRRGPKLSGVFKGEGSDSAQPWRSHRCEGRECRTPFAGSGATSEDLRVWWEAPVARPQVEDVHGGLLARDKTRVPQQAKAGQVICEKGIEGPGLQRKASNEHVVRSLGGGRDRRAGGVRDRHWYRTRSVPQMPGWRRAPLRGPWQRRVFRLDRDAGARLRRSFVRRSNSNRPRRPRGRL